MAAMLMRATKKRKNMMMFSFLETLVISAHISELYLLLDKLHFVDDNDKNDFFFLKSNSFFFLSSRSSRGDPLKVLPDFAFWTPGRSFHI